MATKHPADPQRSGSSRSKLSKIGIDPISIFNIFLIKDMDILHFTYFSMVLSFVAQRGGQFCCPKGRTMSPFSPLAVYQVK